MTGPLRCAAAVWSAVLLASAGPAPAAEPTPPVAWTPERTLQVRQVGSVQVAPDGRRVAYTVRQAVMDDTHSEYRTHIHLADADGSDPLQLTQGDASCDQPRWSPDGQTLAFLSARGGKRNVWLIPTGGGEARRLTDSKTDVTSLKWSPDGTLLAFTALDAPTAEEEKARRGKDDARVGDEDIKQSRLYVVAAHGAIPPRVLTPATYSVGTESGSDRRGGYDWAPNSRTIVFTHTRGPSPNDWPSADLSAVYVPGCTVTPLARTKAAEFSPLFSPDGRWVAYVASDDPPTWGSNATVYVLPAGGGSPRPLAETFDRFGRYSELVGWSADGKRLFYTEARGTVLHLNALPLDGPPQPLSEAVGVFPGGVTLNAARTAFGFGWETLTAPPEAAWSPVDRVEPKVVSRVNRGLPDAPLGRTEVVRWKAPDGQQVEGLLTYPAVYQKGKRYPTLLVIHGGPMGVFTQTFPAAAAGSYPVAAFAARGYAVLRPNPRGSSGYGKEFRYANYGDWGGKDYQDLMTGLDHIVAQGIADPDRLGVMGWSYGGFMTAWTITQTKRFKAASVGAGVTNLMSFTGTADIPNFLPDYFGGDPWDNFEAYRAHSAMFHVKGVTTPTLIQHGEEDRRVPLSQGQELYNALKRQGCPTRMVVYPRTPHAIEEPKLLLDCMQRNLRWFDQYVRGQ